VKVLVQLEGDELRCCDCSEPQPALVAGRCKPCLRKQETVVDTLARLEETIDNVIRDLGRRRDEERGWRKALLDHLDKLDPLPLTTDLRRRFLGL
jgi:hypothetical protein